MKPVKYTNYTRYADSLTSQRRVRSLMSGLKEGQRIDTGIRADDERQKRNFRAQLSKDNGYENKLFGTQISEGWLWLERVR